MKKNEPTYQVSAIVSTYNAEQFIAGCIEDLQNQTIADQTEIIVVDSASPQNEGDIVRSFQKKYTNIRYIRTAERESVYSAWNRGVAMAQGKYLTNANTDDRHRQDAFEQMAAVLDQRSDIALVYADVLKTQSGNEIFEHCDPNERISWFDWERKLLMQKGCFIGPQPMWRKDVHTVFGGFDETLVSSGDYEYWLRISQLYNFHHIRDPMGLYLERADSVEHANADMKSAEDIKIQAEYLRAAINHHLIRCRPLNKLQSLLESDTSNTKENLPACLDELEPFICPDVQGRRVTARSETQRFLELKYKIVSGKINPAHSTEVLDAISRLMLISMEWYRTFWDDLRRRKGTSGVAVASGMSASSKFLNSVNAADLSN